MSVATLYGVKHDDLKVLGVAFISTYTASPSPVPIGLAVTS